jgi:hypothetical protein
VIGRVSLLHLVRVRIRVRVRITVRVRVRVIGLLSPSSTCAELASISSNGVVVQRPSSSRLRMACCPSLQMIISSCRGG